LKGNKNQLCSKNNIKKTTNEVLGLLKTVFKVADWVEKQYDFLPAVGWRIGDNGDIDYMLPRREKRPWNGKYWSSAQDEAHSSSAFMLYFSNFEGYGADISPSMRRNEHSIRCVCKTK
jgi:hypothetical protein